MADTTRTLAFIFQARNAEQVAAQSELARAALDRLEEQAKLTDRGVDAVGRSGGLAGIGRMAAGFAAAQLAVSSFQSALQTARRTFDFVVKNALEAEEATQRLSFALQQTGAYSAEAVADLQRFAEGLGAITGTSDEAIQRTAALLAQIAGFRGDRLKEVTTAALDLSAALGISADSAARLLGKAALGETGTLSRYAILVDEGASASQKFAQALGQIQSKFGGTAAAVGQTGAGAFRAFREEIGNVAELLGGPMVEKMAGGLRRLADGLRAMRGEIAAPEGANVFSTWLRDLEAFSLHFKAAGADVEEFRKRAEALSGRIVKEFQLRVRSGDINEAVALFREVEEAAAKSAASGERFWEQMLQGIRDAAAEGFSMRLNLDTSTAQNSLRSFLRELQSKEDVFLVSGDQQIADAIAGLRGVKTEQAAINEEVRAFEAQLKRVLDLRRQLETVTGGEARIDLVLNEQAAVREAERLRASLAAQGVTLPVGFDFRTLTSADVTAAIDAVFVDADLVKQVEVEVLAKIDAAKTEADIAAVQAQVGQKISELFDEFTRTGSRSARALGLAYAQVFESIKADAQARAVEIRVLADTKDAAKAIDIVTAPRPPVEVPIVLLPPDFVKTKEGINLGLEETNKAITETMGRVGQDILGTFGELFGAMVGITRGATDAMDNLVKGLVVSILKELAKLAAATIFKLFLKLAGITIGAIGGGPAGAAIAIGSGIAGGVGLPGGGSAPHPGPAKATAPAPAGPPPAVPAPEKAPPVPEIVVEGPRVTVEPPEVSVSPPAVSVAAPAVSVAAPVVSVSPPVVSVPAPEISVPAPVVSLPAPVVSVSPAVPVPAPEVAVTVPDVLVPTPRVDVRVAERAALPRPARLEVGSLDEFGRFAAAVSGATQSLASLVAFRRLEVLPEQSAADRLLSQTVLPPAAVVNISALDAVSFENWIRSGAGGRVLSALAATGRVGI